MPDSYTDSQKKITKESIFTALMILLEKRQFNEITITELTTLAGVSRMAFYRNYFVKDDIIINYLDELFEDFKNEIKESGSKTSYDIALLYFSCFKKQKQFIEVLVKSNLIYIFYDRFNLYLTDFSSDYENEAKTKYFNYFVQFARGGLYSILLEWIKNDTKESVEEMAKLFVEITHQRTS